MKLEFKHERYLMRYIAPANFYTCQIFLYVVYTVCTCIRYISFYTHNNAVFFSNDLVCIAALIVMFTVLNPFKVSVYARTVEVVHVEKKADTVAPRYTIRTSDGSAFTVKTNAVSEGDRLILAVPYDWSNDAVKTFDTHQLTDRLSVYACRDDGSMKWLKVEETTLDDFSLERW